MHNVFEFHHHAQWFLHPTFQQISEIKNTKKIGQIGINTSQHIDIIGNNPNQFFCIYRFHGLHTLILLGILGRTPSQVWICLAYIQGYG